MDVFNWLADFIFNGKTKSLGEEEVPMIARVIVILILFIFFFGVFITIIFEGINYHIPVLSVAGGIICISYIVKIAKKVKEYLHDNY